MNPFKNPFKVVEMFEEAIAEYCGAPYAVACDSATNAMLICLDYFRQLDGSKDDVTIPSKTYVSVPQVIKSAGFNVLFDDYEWQHEGLYQLAPYPVWDSARLCTSDMHIRGRMECLSLHWGKTLNLGQGGVILVDDKEIADWLKKARWDGRTAGIAPKDDEITFIARHCPMSPRDAADALTRLHFLPKHNKPLPVEKGYADLSKFRVFK